ncbi:LuxR C-terminal-related transcriptional regulator [Arthrobacter sp. efr-133-TYG-118]|uniref:helix-turn-helix transcriptional regulator n=1 Tax=Arthrobacter sp. efr-133-TYG-118 TaxID=3040279 RepID=UPI00254B4309|nr:LuxR C-terminal-related transcriptional regulator [Arthrobacter sp. efr-133-TYG-118]
MRSLKGVPFAGLHSLELGHRNRGSGIVGLSDVLSGLLAKQGPRFILVDDIENLDSETLAVIDVAQKRTQRPLIVTMSDSPSGSTPLLGLDCWPAVTVPLQPLGYVQVEAVSAEILGAPADDDVVARVFSWSGGNPRLVARILESAVVSERLVLRGGSWHINGRTLMNVHLHGTVEGLLYGLERDERTALRTIAITGFWRLDHRTTIGADVLGRLEHRGLLAVVAGADGVLAASVVPPLIADYLRNQVRGLRERSPADDFRPVPATEAAIKELSKRYGLEDQPGAAVTPGSAGQRLTKREAEVALLAGNLDNREIASRLGVSIRTVESHLANARRKTRTQTRKGLFHHVHRAAEPGRPEAPGLPRD